MLYFNYFPVMLYDPAGSGDAKLVTNIIKRVRLRSDMKKEITLLDQYDIKEGETPEIVADKHHGSPLYHWIVMLVNELADVNHDWPKSTRQLQMYVSDKYGSTINDPHHYYIFQSSGDSTITIECNSTQAGAVTVTNYDYEVELNDSKRKISLLRNEYLGNFVEEFETLVA